MAYGATDATPPTRGNPPLPPPAAGKVDKAGAALRAAAVTRPCALSRSTRGTPVLKTVLLRGVPREARAKDRRLLLAQVTKLCLPQQGSLDTHPHINFFLPGMARSRSAAGAGSQATR